MVRCTKCGVENEEDAAFCKACGNPLHPEPPGTRRRHDTCFGPSERGPEQECFGIPYGGLIPGLVVGSILILLGLSTIFDIAVSRYIPAIIMATIGIVIILAALYSYRRRP